VSVYDESVVTAAEGVVATTIQAALAAKSGEAVIGVAPAGADKSYAIGTAVEAARRAGLRVAVATPTNEQAFALVADLADRLPKERVVFVHATHRHLPERMQRRNAEEKAAKDSAGDRLVVGTLNKLGDALRASWWGGRAIGSWWRGSRRRRRPMWGGTRTRRWRGGTCTRRCSRRWGGIGWREGKAAWIRLLDGPRSPRARIFPLPPPAASAYRPGRICRPRARSSTFSPAPSCSRSPMAMGSSSGTAG